jgi:hypothetical protein
MRTVIPGRRQFAATQQRPSYFVGDCQNCGCKVEFAASEANPVLRQMFGDYKVICPTEHCDQFIKGRLIS